MSILPLVNLSEDGEPDQIRQVSEDVALHIRQESALLFNLEQFFSPAPAQLYMEGESSTSWERIKRITMLYADARVDDVDMYMLSACVEAIASFQRARRSLCRAHAYAIGVLSDATGLTFVANVTDTHKPSADELKHLRDHSVSEAVDTFWEHMETSFIRFASYWDRVGQVLDFAFFSIRQYEREGFPAVLDRMRANTMRVDVALEASESWKALWGFKASQSENGLQWLLARRNMLVHSLHLRDIDFSRAPVFDELYNHLDEKRRRALATGSPAEELLRAHTHLATAANLWPHVLALCEYQGKKQYNGIIPPSMWDELL